MPRNVYEDHKKFHFSHVKTFIGLITCEVTNPTVHYTLGLKSRWVPIHKVKVGGKKKTSPSKSCPNHVRRELHEFCFHIKTILAKSLDRFHYFKHIFTNSIHVFFGLQFYKFFLPQLQDYFGFVLYYLPFMLHKGNSLHKEKGVFHMFLALLWWHTTFMLVAVNTVKKGSISTIHLHTVKVTMNKWYPKDIYIQMPYADKDILWFRQT